MPSQASPGLLLVGSPRPSSFAKRRALPPSYRGGASGREALRSRWKGAQKPQLVSGISSVRRVPRGGPGDTVQSRAMTSADEDGAAKHTIGLDVGGAVVEFLRREVVAESLGPHDDRVSCLTPLDYPGGDGVVVWVIPRKNGEFEATDYGEGHVALAEHPAPDRQRLLDQAVTICAELAVSFVEGRVVTYADAASLGDAVWRVASASAQIAQMLRRRRRSGASTHASR